MLAKNPRAPRGVRFPALSLATIVGTPPGTCSLLQGIEVHPSKSGRLSGRLALLLIAGDPRSNAFVLVVG
jgi:hypothetical protein